MAGPIEVYADMIEIYTCMFRNGNRSPEAPNYKASDPILDIVNVARL